jgi:Glycine/D-amino acid oxidases (deaminating)
MPKRASALVIGAGIIGASVAYNLSKTLPPPIIIVDMMRAGSGSTAAALGGFRHQFSSRLNVQLSIESINILEKFNDTMGVDPLIRYDGYLFIAQTEQSLSMLRYNAEMQRSLGVPVETHSGEEIQRLFPFYDFSGVLGGNLCYRDGHALTSAVHQGYLSKALSLGAQLLENTRVTGMIIDGQTIKGVATNLGTIYADRVVISAGAYTAQLGKLAGIDIPVIPQPRKILFTRGVPSNLPNSFPLIVNVDSTFALGREQNSIFFSDNRWMIQGFDVDFPSEYDEQVYTEAVRRLPPLADLSIGYTVRGLYETTPDANPIVSECEISGLYCCAGFNGHGFMHAPAVGVLMSELIKGEKPHLDISEFSLKRFGERGEREFLVI